MKRNFLSIMLFLVILLAAYCFGRWERTTVNAQAHQYIQKSFGHCVGAYSAPAATILIFEDSAGVIHLVDARNGNVISVYDRL